MARLYRLRAAILRISDAIGWLRDHRPLVYERGDYIDDVDAARSYTAAHYRFVIARLDRLLAAATKAGDYTGAAILARAIADIQNRMPR